MFLAYQSFLFVFLHSMTLLTPCLWYAGKSEGELLWDQWGESNVAAAHLGCKSQMTANANANHGTARWGKLNADRTRKNHFIYYIFCCSLHNGFEYTMFCLHRHAETFCFYSVIALLCFWYEWLELHCMTQNSINIWKNESWFTATWHGEHGFRLQQ